MRTKRQAPIPKIGSIGLFKIPNGFGQLFIRIGVVTGPKQDDVFNCEITYPDTLEKDWFTESSVFAAIKLFKATTDGN